MPKSWTGKYVAYEKKGSDSFLGDKVETVIVLKETGKVVGHLKGWVDGSVISDWDPTVDGLVGIDWAKDRPKGYRKCYHQDYVLDWGVEVLKEV